MAQAEIYYRNQQVLFPVVDDIEDMNARKRTDRRQAFSTSGVPEMAMILPFEEVDIRIPDVVQDSLVDNLSAFWSHARRGGTYSFAFADDDKVLTALEENVAAGASTFYVAEARGIVAGRKYVMMHDLLGRNTSQNLLSAAQAICDSPSAYSLVYGGPLPVAHIYTPPKEGQYALRISVAPGYTLSFRAAGPAVPRWGYLTFSVWVRLFSPPNRFFLRIAGNGVDVSSPKIAGGGGAPLFRRYSVTALFPEGASSTIVSIDTDTTWHDYIHMHVDAWQAELKQHATPWVEGSQGVDEKTASTEGLSEIVEVQSVSQAGGYKNRIILAAPLKFDYSARDVFRSRYYWERAVSLDTDSPLRLKSITSEFRHRFREIA